MVSTDVSPSLGDAEPDVVITLVHGTFASRAPWTQEQSTLRRRWVVGPQRAVSFIPFDWSGVNTHDGRQKASEELAIHLQTVIAAHPTAAHLVIAHSHGGNVALKALDQEGHKLPIKALVCLNTPFLNYEKRSLKPLIWFFYILNPIAVLFLFFPYDYQFLSSDFPFKTYINRYLAVNLFESLLFLVLLIAIPFYKLYNYLLGKLKTWQERRFSELNPVKSRDYYFFSATVVQDEAYWYLWFLDRVTSFVALGLELSYILISCGVIIFYSFTFIGWIFSYLFLPPSFLKHLETFSHNTVLVVIAGGIIFFLSLIILTLTTEVLRRHKFSYGEPLTDSLLLNISVKAYPIFNSNQDSRFYKYNKHHKFPGSYLNIVKLKLNHSVLYDSEEVIEMIALWFYGLPK